MEEKVICLSIPSRFEVSFVQPSEMPSVLSVLGTGTSLDSEAKLLCHNCQKS